MKNIKLFLFALLSLLLSVPLSVQAADGLITSVDQLYSPCTRENSGSHNYELANMLDRDTTSYWCPETDGDLGTKYFEVELPYECGKVYFVFTRRYSATANKITEWGVYGAPANDLAAEKTSCVELAHIETPYNDVRGETLTSDVFDTKGYTHVRFYIENTTTPTQPYGSVAEFQLYEVADDGGDAVSLSDMRVYSVSDAITTLPEEGRWYLIKNDRKSGSTRNTWTPAYETENGEILRAADDTDVVPGVWASDVASFLLGTTPTGQVSSYASQYGAGDVYTLQWATGGYWQSGSNNATVTTTADASGAASFNVYHPTGATTGFCVNVYDMGVRLNNNGAGSNVLWYGSGVGTDTEYSNSVFTLHEVSFTFTDEERSLEDLISEAQEAYDTYEDGVFDLSVETGFTSGNGVGKGLITSTSQFSSPYTETAEGSIDNLLDNNSSTFWHSAWKGGSVADGLHYLQVDMADDFLGGALMVDILRRASGSDHVTEMRVTDGDGNYIATIELPYGSQGEHVQAGFNCPEGVKTLRFYEEATTSGNGYFHLANFQLFYTTYTASTNEKHADVSAALADAIAGAEAAIYGHDGVDAAADALQSALDEYLVKIVMLYDTPVEDGEYVLRNAGTGLYVAGANAWGTQASLLAQPLRFTLGTQSDGSYRLNSDLGNSSGLYLGIDPNAPSEDPYVDQASSNSWIITETEGGYTLQLVNTSVGTYNGYYLTGGSAEWDACVLSSDASEASEWELVSIEDIRAEQAGLAAGGSMDVTPLIANGSFGANTEGTAKTHWTVTSYDGTADADNSDSANANNAFESWRSSNGFNVSQTLEGLAAGEYKLSAQAFYLDYDATGEGLPVLYAGSAETTPMNMHDADGACTAVNDGSQQLSMAHTDFVAGLYPVELSFTVGTDGEDVTIGYKGSSVAMWNTLGGLTLTYSVPERLDPGTVVHECGAELADWTTTGNNGSHELNTWSTEADASGMVPPFCQNWVASSSSLTTATISHNTLTDLISGYYLVTLDARIFSEAGNAIAAGTTLSANGEAVDLVATGTSATYGTETEVYGGYSVAAGVTDGTLSVSLNIPSGVSYNWLAWKNLSVTYYGDELPAIAAAEGTMNAAVSETMATALAAYGAENTPANYNAALTAVRAAEKSAEYYAGIAAVVDNLDEAGQAAFAATSEGEAYAALALDGEDITATLVEAQKAQTTPGSDLSLVATSDGQWVNDTGTYGEAVERYVGGTTADPTAGFTEGMTLYKEITGLTPGVYTVTFYAVANSTNERDDVDAAAGENIAEAFANDSTESVTVGEATGCVPSDYPYTITCTVGDDGTLRFGLQNVATGGNWYVCQAVSLTLVELTAEEEEEDLTELIAKYEADLAEAAEVTAGLEEKIAAAKDDEGYDSTILSNMEDALAGLQEVVGIYGGIDTTDTTADELTEAIEAIESALASAGEALATALSGVTATTGNDVIYTIGGVRVSDTGKPGVYIVNGKKVMVK